jgi:hypothetical protein
MSAQQTIKQTTEQTNKLSSAEDVLKLIIKGDIDIIVPENKRKVKMVEVRKKIPNVILRKTVEKLRAQNKMNDTRILNQILNFDEMAEKGELLNFLNKRKVNKK